MMVLCAVLRLAACSFRRSFLSAHSLQCHNLCRYNAAHPIPVVGRLRPTEMGHLHIDVSCERALMAAVVLIISAGRRSTVVNKGPLVN